MATPDEPEPGPGAGIPQPLVGYQVPAAPLRRQQADMTDEEIEAAFAALWKKMERCE